MQDYEAQIMFELEEFKVEKRRRKTNTSNSNKLDSAPFGAVFIQVSRCILLPYCAEQLLTAWMDA